MKQNRTDSDEEDQIQNEDDILKNDPYYINENQLKEEEDTFDETQKQVINLANAFLRVQGLDIFYFKFKRTD